jgi:hypothetical protein
LVSSLIASRITFAESDQLAVVRDIFLVDETLHYDLHGRGDKLPGCRKI